MFRRTCALRILPPVLIATLGGCSDPTLATRFDACAPTEIVLPESLAPAVASAIADGVRFWSEPLSMPWTTTAAATTGASSIPLRFIDTGLFYGRYDDLAPAIILSSGVTDPARLSIVVAHEVGHALGLYHRSPDARVSVMNPGNVNVAPNAEDLAEITAIWGACTTGARRGMLAPP